MLLLSRLFIFASHATLMYRARISAGLQRALISAHGCYRGITYGLYYHCCSDAMSSRQLSLRLYHLVYIVLISLTTLNIDVRSRTANTARLMIRYFSIFITIQRQEEED